MQKKLNGTQLKTIAVVTMVIDHIGASVLQRYLYMDFPAELTTANYEAWMDSHLAGYLIYELLRMIGRIAFPIFTFLLVEGVCHTSSSGRYALRMFLFALAAEIPFDLAFSYKAVDPEYQNVMFTLCIGILMLNAIREYTEKRAPKENAGKVFLPAGALAGACLIWLYADVTTLVLPLSTASWIGAGAGALICLLAGRKLDTRRKASATYLLFIGTAAAALAELLKTDYGGVGILTILLMYIARGNTGKQILLGWIPLAADSFGTTEILSILSGLYINRYNGERGRKTGVFFYFFYPAHLLLLYFISCLVV